MHYFLSTIQSLQHPHPFLEPRTTWTPIYFVQPNSMNLCYVLDDTTFKSYNGQCFTNTDTFEIKDEITNTPNYVPQSKKLNKQEKLNVLPNKILPQIPQLPKKKYLKKNTESNISNQAFSFISSKSKSSLILKRIIRHSQMNESGIVDLFYEYMRIIKRQKPKYLNKKVLIQLCYDDKGEGLLAPVRLNKLFQSRLPLSEFCRLSRILLRYFLSHLCPLSIITSKKLSRDTSMQHLQRRRQILQYIRHVPLNRQS